MKIAIQLFCRHAFNIRLIIVAKILGCAQLPIELCDEILHECKYQWNAVLFEHDSLDICDEFGQVKSHCRNLPLRIFFSRTSDRLIAISMELEKCGIPKDVCKEILSECKSVWRS